MKKLHAFTIIELLLSVFIIATLTFSILSAINYTLSQNAIITAKNSAYIIADNALKSKSSLNEYSVKFNNVDYTVKISEKKMKPKDLFNFSDDYLNLISDNIEITVKSSAVKWNIGTRQFTVNIEKYKDAEF
ncbi:type II secretion system protein [Candidatus Dependentiae bacterium]|nr:type II secretion system protein [Candidatus Dependentiae bacterium]